MSKSKCQIKSLRGVGSTSRTKVSPTGKIILKDAAHAGLLKNMPGKFSFFIDWSPVVSFGENGYMFRDQ